MVNDTNIKDDIWDVNPPNVPYYAGSVKQDRRSQHPDWDIYIQPTRLEVFPPRVRVIVAHEELGKKHNYNPNSKSQFTVELQANGEFTVSKPEALARMDVEAEAQIKSLATAASYGLKRGISELQSETASPPVAMKNSHIALANIPVKAESIAITPQLANDIAANFTRKQGVKIRDFHAPPSFSEKVKKGKVSTVQLER